MRHLRRTLPILSETTSGALKNPPHLLGLLVIDNVYLLHTCCSVKYFILTLIPKDKMKYSGGIPTVSLFPRCRCQKSSSSVRKEPMHLKEWTHYCLPGDPFGLTYSGYDTSVPNFPENKTPLSGHRRNKAR